ncbi:uncharacterized protein SCHCODRAFT_02042516 [Schizophyllum commune H4-8]|uniref:uncharacterized protein n=1 Tax=Schizophyllum commune (strain H4-8 / FGSC 9210) TaxID=578458 RepID=UPI002160E0DF|nr:uncharacterized protein SCHCODRAFT_02042516 [Schizophyllum commune H4-8]KAI5900703.1 hypothetical protein SCHCODRAFT_02042516 [Schizophyllum commune H4-8]
MLLTRNKTTSALGDLAPGEAIRANELPPTRLRRTDRGRSVTIPIPPSLPTPPLSSAHSPTSIPGRESTSPQFVNTLGTNSALQFGAITPINVYITLL